MSWSSGSRGRSIPYVAIGLNVAGDRDALGMWVGTGGESSKH